MGMHARHSTAAGAIAQTSETSESCLRSPQTIWNPPAERPFFCSSISIRGTRRSTSKTQAASQKEQYSVHKHDEHIRYKLVTMHLHYQRRMRSKEQTNQIKKQKQKPNPINATLNHNKATTRALIIMLYQLVASFKIKSMVVARRR